MKNRIKEYVDKLFSDIYETKELQELKEEICTNLLENINDLISRGNNEDTAFEKAVSNLGDMSELIESLKIASEIKSTSKINKSTFIKSRYVIGNIIASAIFLFGIMAGVFIYLQQKDMMASFKVLMPFVFVSVPIFNYFTLTQKTKHNYGMNSKNALLYTIASEMILIGVVLAVYKYFQGQKPVTIFTVIIPFLMVSAIIYIYLGLTAKKRRKMDAEWMQQWINHYSNPQLAAIEESISGVLWVFSISAFFFISLTWGWKYSWIVFSIAIICQVIILAIFDRQPTVIMESISVTLWISCITAFILIGITLGWKYAWLTLAFAIICQILIEAIFALRQKEKND